MAAHRHRTAFHERFEATGCWVTAIIAHHEKALAIFKVSQSSVSGQKIRHRTANAFRTIFIVRNSTHRKRGIPVTRESDNAAMVTVAASHDARAEVS